ncbi:MAG: hypothetical protein QG610_2311, partial [Euryarchaeota archaeon]|nr:hypothetical protein [Euryarchaeota archaeon]
MVETERGRRIAILIGTNEYSKMEKLEFAESDAREMAKILLDPDICGFDEVIQLIDKGKEEVSQTIEKVFKNAKQNDEVLIYYSGHGKPSYKFDLCLLFKDTDPESLLATSLKFDYINECKEQSACKRLVIILDCCYSGTAGMRGNYLEEMLSSYSGSGTVLLTSTGETGSNIAKEDRELKHGVFTSYLLKGLKDWAADDNDDGIVTVDDLYKYTFNQTKAKGLQRPQKKGSYEGEMILGRNIPKIKRKELEEKNEKLMKYLSSSPPDVLYRSLTILQKMYEDLSALDPAELNIKPHLEALLEGKIEVENYIKIVKYQEKLQKQKGKEKKQQGVQEAEKETQDKLQKRAEEEQQKEELHRQKREEKDKKEKIVLEAKQAEEQKEKSREKEERDKKEKEFLEAKKLKEQKKESREEEKKAIKEQKEQEKLQKYREEAGRKKLEASKAQAFIPSAKKPDGSSGKGRLQAGIILVVIILGLILVSIWPDSGEEDYTEEVEPTEEFVTPAEYVTEEDVIEEEVTEEEVTEEDITEEEVTEEDITE